MGMTFSITDNSDLVKNALPEAKERALEAIGMQAEGYAKQELSNSPKRIDTGLLRNSITHAVSGKPAATGSYTADKPKEGRQNSGSYSGQAQGKQGDAVYVGTNVEYATYVHDGTSKMAANRFIKNGIVKHKDVFKGIAERELKKG